MRTVILVWCLSISASLQAGVIYRYHVGPYESGRGPDSGFTLELVFQEMLKANFGGGIMADASPHLIDYRLFDGRRSLSKADGADWFQHFRMQTDERGTVVGWDIAAAQGITPFLQKTGGEALMIRSWKHGESIVQMTQHHVCTGTHARTGICNQRQSTVNINSGPAGTWSVLSFVDESGTLALSFVSAIGWLACRTRHAAEHRPDSNFVPSSGVS